MSDEIRGRVVSWILDVANRRWSRRAHSWLLVVALVLFLLSVGLALPRVAHLQVDLGWLGLAAGVSALLPLLNATEYWLAARWVGVSVTPLQSIRITVLASAANLAPLPGAALVRGRELYNLGGELQAVTRSLAAIAMSWLSVSLSATAISIALVGSASVAVGFLSVTLVSAGLIIFLLPTESGRSMAMLECVLLEVAIVGVQGTAIYAAFHALSLDISLVQAIGLPAAGAVSSAIGVLPGGLGLREVLAGGLAPLLGLEPSTGVLGTAADRVIGLTALAVVSSVVAISADFSSDGESKDAT